MYVCVKLGSPESLESVGKYVGGPPSHQATKPLSQRAATLVGRAPATLPPSQLAQLPTTATSPPCPTLSRLECATTQRGAQRCVPNHQQGVPLRCPGQGDMRLSRCLPTKVGRKCVHFLLLRRIPPGWTGEPIPTTTCTGHPAFTMLSTGFGYRLLVPRCFLLLPPYKPARHQLTRRTQGLERTEGVCKSIQQLVLCNGPNFLLFPLIRPNRTH